jgi:glycerophosphoryl diester phosphodiesterase
VTLKLPYALMLGVALVACSAAAESKTAVCPPSPFRSDKLLVIAHAGGEGLGPSNTVEAMKASMAAGADVLDADVRITADGVLVAIHDATIDATTNGTGKVAELTLAELQSFDAGYRFRDPNGAYSFRGKGVVVPTVEDILVSFPDVLTSLELKVAGEASTALCDLLRRHDRMTNVYVSSDGDAGVDQILKACPETITTVTDALLVPMRAARESGSAWCSPVPIGQPPFSSRQTAESVAWAHDHGLAEFTWTIDDPQTITELVTLGMDGVYTRRPDIARRVIDQASG